MFDDRKAMEQEQQEAEEKAKEAARQKIRNKLDQRPTPAHPYRGSLGSFIGKSIWACRHGQSSASALTGKWSRETS